MKTKIILGLSKKRYLKKYKNNKFLLCFTKKEIGNYNVEYSYLNPEADHVLQGKKWALIGDSYYEMPRVFTPRWFKTLGITAKFATIVVSVGVLGSSVGLPVYFTNFYYVPVSETIDELLTSDAKEKKLILETVDISNSKVKLGKDFETVLIVKEDHKEDYVIEDTTKVYAEKEGVKVELIKDKDYTFENNGQKAELKVFASAVTGKIEVDIKLREISYNRIVDFIDEEHGFDNNEHPFKYTLKEGRTLPEGTLITYSWNDEVKTGDNYFSFQEAGTYNVTLKLEHSEKKYNTFTKTAKMTINKNLLPEEQKQYFKFNISDVPEYDHESAPIPQVEEGGVPFESYSPIMYSSTESGPWSEERPTSPGDYFVKTTLSFKNFSNFDLIKSFHIKSYRANINFKLEDDIKRATWGEGGSKETRAVSNKIVTPGETNLQNFLDDASISGAFNPYALGYTFTNKWKSIDDEKIYVPNQLIETVEDNPITLNLIPIFEGEEQTVAINTNGGYVINKQGKSAATTLIKCGEKVKEIISNNLETPTHDYASFSKWVYWDETSKKDIEIDDDLVMIPELSTIKPLWNTYDIHLVVEGGTISGQGEGYDLFTNKLVLYTDEFVKNINPETNKVLDHFEFSVDDGETYLNLNNGMPFKPYLENNNAPKNIILKAVYVDAPTIVEIFVDADTGAFDEAGEIKFMSLEVPFYGIDNPKNKTLNDVLAIIGKPKKGDTTANGWVDDEGISFDVNNKINNDLYVRAIYNS